MHAEGESYRSDKYDFHFGVFVITVIHYCYYASLHQNMTTENCIQILK